MATFQQIINRVLTAIGQGDDLVSAAVTDTYQLKVAQFVNDILEEVEDAAPWRVLRTTVSATIAANTNSVALAGTNERTRVWYEVNQDNGKLQAVCFDVTDTANQLRLEEMDLATLRRLDQENSNVAVGSTPSHFAMEKGANDVTIYTWPRTTADVNLEIDLLVPQARLDPTDTDDLAIVIKVPTLPVVYGATWWAMEDRGEELGPRGDKAEARFRTLLSDSVAAEVAEQGYDELVPT